MNDWLRKWPVTDYTSAMAHLAQRSKRVRADAPIGHALRLVANHVGPGSVSVTYHQTPIVTFYADGTQVLDWGGWYTKTTFDHIARIAQLGDFRLSAHNRQRNGHGDGVALSRDLATWPRTPSRVTRCRTCKGTGRYERWEEEWDCRRCGGAGSCERGNQAIPETYDGTFQLVLHPDDTYEVRYGDPQPTYECSCGVCKCGCGSWQSHWQCTEADKWAVKKTPNYKLLDQSTPVPAQSAFTMHSEVLSALAVVLPNLDHEVKCPKCTTSEPLRSVVVHMNDEHRVPREEVADWLDTLDLDLKFPTPA